MKEYKIQNRSQINSHSCVPLTGIKYFVKADLMLILSQNILSMVYNGEPAPCGGRGVKITPHRVINTWERGS
jgi:hypothetical protein